MAKRSSASKRSRAHRALVTGASAGIGAAFARRLARDGYHLILVARSRERLETMAEELQHDYSVAVEPLPADLTQGTELRVIEDFIVGNDLDLLVNNAGFGTAGAFHTLDTDEEEKEIQLNVVALVRLARAALPGMVKRRSGAIINVSSMAGFSPTPYNATYGATKAFVTSFTEALYEELRDTGVQVQALCPGFTRTEFQERAGIDVSNLPDFAWMSADAVVDAALDGLQRGSVVCVPGVANRLLATVTAAIPRSLTRRITGTFMREYL